MSTGADSVVRDYYDALRNGDPLEPFFLEGDATVKFGISEALFGYERVCKSLQSQTASTEHWSVESRHLVVDERDGVATMADEVTMAWTDAETGDRRRFETRWSGTLRHDDAAGGGDSDASGNGDSGPAWRFATMHVSTADEL